MARIASREELLERRRVIAAQRDDAHKVIRVCNTGCQGKGSSPLAEALAQHIAQFELAEKVKLKKTGCHGYCEIGPVLVIEPQGILYQQVKPGDAEEIIAKTVREGELLERLLYRDPQSGEVVVHEGEVPFYRHQTKRVSGRCGRIDPTDIDDYLAEGGYLSLAKALESMTPGEIIQAVEDSGLRGRGGGGFPAGRKWRSCRQAPGLVKYVIANGDEGDPGAFMDRSLMEGDPHGIIEGMIIGAYAIGARRGYIYVRDEYPMAVKHLSIAIEQATQCGLLGEDILGSGFSFGLEINRGAGAFVCGESTALMNSLQGQVGEPRAKYIHTVESGLWDCPSNLNNVETWANVPLIIEQGASGYAETGTAGSPGTKIFSLVGKVKNTGLVEVPMGITLKKIIYEIGGGIKRDRTLKAVQTGGPSGGCLPATKMNTPVDFDSLTQAGAIMGSGGMIIMDQTTCMVDVAKYFVNFLRYESCGKCLPCREGLQRMHEILGAICEGQGKPEDIDLLQELATFMDQACLCALGSTAPNPVLSTIRYFREEYLAHILEKKCRAGVCRNLFEYNIDGDLCNGCTICRQKCPQNAVSGEKKKPHAIDLAQCTRCGICFSLCPQEAVQVR